MQGMTTRETWGMGILLLFAIGQVLHWWQLYKVSERVGA